MTQVKQTLNPAYTEAVIALWCAAEDMFTHSQEPVKELFRLASVLGFVARQANKVESLRDAFGKAKIERDVPALRRLKVKAEHMVEEKSFEACWSYCAGSYDKFRKDLIANAPNNTLLQTTQTSSEIYDKAKQVTAIGSAKDVDELIKLVQCEIDL